MRKALLVIFSILFSLSASLQAQDEQKQVFSEAELEQILAPIALYPDSVLTHILIASTYPIELVQADRWVSKHPDLEPGDAANQVEDKDWDPSVKALVPFPNILERLSDNLDWTQRLGDAFLQSEERVLDAIQSLRRQADDAGNLDKMENMKVSREKKVIIIEPVEREVVYVPYYDTRYIYGHWRWAHYPPVYWRHSYYHYHHHRPYYWYPRVRIRFGFFFNAFHWHNHHIVHINHHYYHHHRRHYHRRDIIRHNDGRRWHHNPTHRRGVAYRTNLVRDRYRSTRPSYTQTRATRLSERNMNVRRVSDNNAIRASRQSNTAQQLRASRQSSSTRQPQSTRQHRLRQELRQRQDVVQSRAANRTNRNTSSRNTNRVNTRNQVNRNQVNRNNQGISQRQQVRDRREATQQVNSRREVRSNHNRQSVNQRRSNSNSRTVNQPRQAPRQVQPQRSQSRSQSTNRSNYKPARSNQPQVSSGNRSSSNKSRASSNRSSSSKSSKARRSRD